MVMTAGYPIVALWRTRSTSPATGRLAQGNRRAIVAPRGAVSSCAGGHEEARTATHVGGALSRVSSDGQDVDLVCVIPTEGAQGLR